MNDIGDTQGLDGVAIIGMSGRFPGANNVHELWQNLVEGKESIRRFSDAELDPSIQDSLKNNPNYIKVKGLIDDADKFDARFFNINPREAAMMDPQQRIFLEEALHALEDGGYNPDSFKGLIGVFGGTGTNSYFVKNVLSNPELVESFGEHQTNIANGPDYLTTRVSYKLNLSGPSLGIFTGCSLSLVAVCNAFDSLLSYQSDMALAGGAFVRSPLNSGYISQEGSMESTDGRCRPFDEKANGTVFSDGVGFVLLKRLSEAIEDGDHIYAVIRGTAMNNDGSKKISFTAPSVDAQAGVIAQAHANAEINPETISYIETHGTATPVGDPIEIEALTKAFRYQTSKNNFCTIGSLKSNIGHLDAAAGVAGLIKTALMLRHKKIPATLHYTKSNPAINFPESPFRVNTELQDWNTNGSARRAGVTSLGVGGTNAHVILEEAPNSVSESPSREKKLILISAKTERSLDQAAIDLSQFITKNPEANLADVAFTLQCGRKKYDCRRMYLCDSSESAVEQLLKTNKKNSISSGSKIQNRDVVFMFSGQGSQYVNMGLELYKSENVFREQMDRCAEYLKPLLKLDIRDIIYPGSDAAEEAGLKLQQTAFTQPALFMVEYALVKLWISWGITPAAFIGHSIGEYVAACLAGVFSLEDALALVANRGRLMQSCTEGSMLAVPRSEKDILPLLPNEISIAVINGPDLCAVAGPKNAIDQFQHKLKDSGIESRQLYVSHAFHSAMMDPVLDDFVAHAEKVHFNKPAIPFISNVSGSWITDEEALNPQYWAGHIRNTVRFSDGIDVLMDKAERVFIEVGPGRTLATLARQHTAQKTEQVILSSIRHPGEDISDQEFILTTLGQLWLNDIEINWEHFYKNETRRRVPLPTYPFERQRFWINPGTLSQDNESTAKKVFYEDLHVEDSNEASTASTEQAHADMTEVESRIAHMWQNLLGVAQVDKTDNFFDLGGSSLMAVRLFAQIESKLKTKLPLASLYQAPTVEQLASLIQMDQKTPGLELIVGIKDSGSRPPFYFVHAEGGNVLEYKSLASYFDEDQPFLGIQAMGLDGNFDQDLSVKAMAETYIKAIKERQPNGPYYIGGYCLGGLIAFEMARQLRENNDEIAYLSILSAKQPQHPFNYGPQATLLHKIYYKLFDRLALEKANFVHLSRQEKINYIFDRFRLIGSKSNHRLEKMLKAIFRKFNIKYQRQSTDFIINELARINDAAFFGYEPKEYKGKMYFFRATKTPKGMEMDEKLGWDGLAAEGIEINDVEGYHKNILREPYVKSVARKLQDSLLQVQKKQNVSIN